MKNVFSFFTLLAVCTFADADCRTRVVVNRNVVVRQHVAAVAVLATPVVAYAQVYQPIYSVAYSGETASSAAALSSKLDSLAKRLDELTANVPERQQQPAAQAKPQTGAHPGAVFLSQSCVKCHDASVAATKGGKQTFFDKGELIATAQQRLEIVASVYDNRMPKGGKASDEDVAALLNYLATSAAKTVQQMPKAK